MEDADGILLVQLKDASIIDQSLASFAEIDCDALYAACLTGILASADASGGGAGDAAALPRTLPKHLAMRTNCSTKLVKIFKQRGFK